MSTNGKRYTKKYRTSGTVLWFLLALRQNVSH